MNENENEQKQEQQEQPTQVDLAKAYQELQKNSISKDEYNKLMEENSQLKTLIIDGQHPTKTDEAEKPKDLEEMKKAWQNPNLNNLEYCEKMLDYRDELIKQGHKDPFLPSGHDHTNTSEDDIKSANKVASVMRECIEEANGNSQVFTAVLNSRMVDDRALLNAINKKR